MLVHLIRMFLLLLPMLPDGSSGGGSGDNDQEDQSDHKDDQGDPGDDEEGDEADDDSELGEAGKRALQRERKRADDAEKQRREADRKLKAMEKQQRDAETATAAEQGDYKKLYDDLKADHDTLESERETERITALRERIARKHQIPDDLFELVQGDEESDITASVKKLAKHVNPGAVDTEAGSGRRGQAQQSQSRQLDDPAPKDGDKRPAYSFIPDGAVIIND